MNEHASLTMPPLQSACAAGVLALSAAIATPAQAIALNFESVFDVPHDAEGVAFHPGTGNLFIAGGYVVTEMTTSGSFVGEFELDLSNVEGIDSLPNGNLLLVSQHGDNLVAEYTPAGAPVASGIGFSTEPTTDNADGIAYNPSTASVFITHNFAFEGLVYEFDASGALLDALDTTTLAPSFDDPEGLSFDPLTGNMLVVSDSGGTASLYEIATDGVVLSATDLFELTGMEDPEGVSVDPGSGNVYVAFNNGDYAVATFSRGAAAAASDVAEPAPLALVGLGLALSALWRRRARSGRPAAARAR